jgi:hypothetical protein
LRFKQVNRNRGGSIELATYIARRDAHNSGRSAFTVTELAISPADRHKTPSALAADDDSPDPLPHRLEPGASARWLVGPPPGQRMVREGKERVVATLGTGSLTYSNRVSSG